MSNSASARTSIVVPLTQALLRHRFDVEKNSLEVVLDALTPYSGPSTSSLVPNSPKDRLAVIQASLSSSFDLVEIIDDQSALEIARSFYGAQMYSALQTKGVGVLQAKALASKLDNQVELMRRQAEDEEARKRVALNHRSSLASQIVGQILQITLFDEKFELTEVLGWHMNAEETKKSLLMLLRADKHEMDADEWRQVHAAFLRIMPGLTVWPARHAEAIMLQLNR